jgi:hypothetical protein
LRSIAQSCDSALVNEPMSRFRPPCEAPSQAPTLYVNDDVLTELRLNCAAYPDRVAFGLLVGHLFEEPAAAASGGATPWAQVVGFVEGAHIDEFSRVATHLRARWQAAGAALRYNFPAATLVGWYASAPGSEGPLPAAATVQLTFFNRPGQALLWLSPTGVTEVWYPGAAQLERGAWATSPSSPPAVR